MEEQRNNNAQQDIAEVNPRSGREQAPPVSPNVGFPNPGSPGEEMGTVQLPPSGDVGTGDLAGDTDLTDDEQAFDRGIIDERRADDSGAR